MLGALAGFFRGWVDSVIMRAVDIMLAIPGLLFAIAVVTFLGRGVVQIAIAIAILNIPIFARLLRGSLLSLREADYVLAARSVGRARPGPALPAHAAERGQPAHRAGHPGAGHRGGGGRRPRASWAWACRIRARRSGE